MIPGIPPFQPTFVTTIEICVALGGLLMAAIQVHKKNRAKKYAAAELRRQKLKEQEQAESRNKPTLEPESGKSEIKTEEKTPDAENR